MFNSYNIKPSQSIKINAVTGAILKNHPKSWFERFHLKSPRADRLLTEGGDKARKKVYDEDYRLERTVGDPENDIIVLQMVICGDMEVMAELIYRRDYEEVKGGE
jgi:hypothetical protein